MLAPLVPLGVVAMVLLVLAARGGDRTSWLCVSVAALGFGVLVRFHGHHPSGLSSAVLLGLATWFAGRGLWSPKPPVEVADRLLGAGLPDGGRYAAWLLLVLSTVGTIAASVLAWRHRDADLTAGEPGAVRRSVTLLVAGAVLTGGAWLGGGVWSGRIADAVLADSEDHTTAAEVPDRRAEPPRGPEHDLAPIWHRGDEDRDADQAALVPGTDLMVALGFATGEDEYGLFVLNAKTGGERWHYWVRSTDNTSAGGFAGVVVGARTETLLAVVSNVAVLFDLDTGQVRSRFALPHVPRDSGYRVLSGSPVRDDRSVIQLSGHSVGYLAARGEGVALLLSVDLTTGEVRTVDRRTTSECHYQLAGPSTRDSRHPGDGAFLVRSGRGCGRPMVLSARRERVVADFELPAVEQAATTCTEPDCDGPTVSVADGRLVVDVGRELLAFDPARPLWTSPVPARAQVTAVGTSEADDPLRVVVETPGHTSVVDGDTGVELGPLAPLPGTGAGAEVTPDTGWYRVHRLDERTVELVRVDLGSLTAAMRSAPMPCEQDPGSGPPPLSAASGRLLIACWPVIGEATMTVLGD